MDGKEVLPSYSEGITSILAWCRANGIARNVSRVLGRDAEVFTTPLGGTYYLVLQYDERCLELVLGGRDLYMMGWRGPNGSYKIKSDSQSVNYMTGTDVRIVKARKNYCNISLDGKAGSIKLGIFEFRRAFDALFGYRGESPGTVQEAIGTIAVYISEATRLKGAFDTVCPSFTDANVSRLNKGTFDTRWVNRYGYYSGRAMEHIDSMMIGKQPPAIENRDIEVESVEEIIREIRLFHIDAYNEGIFKHEPRPEVFVEERNSKSGHNNPERDRGRQVKEKVERQSRREQKKRHDRVKKIVEDQAHHRGYKTQSLYASSPPLPPKDKSGCLEHNKSCSALTALKQLEDETLSFMQHFPALRKLCRMTYEQKLRLSNRTENQQRTQCPKTRFPKLTRQAKRPWWSFQRSGRALLRPGATQHLRLGKFRCVLSNN